MAAKAAAAGASSVHTEPSTPELAPGELRSPSFPVSANSVQHASPVRCSPRGWGTSQSAFGAHGVIWRGALIACPRSLDRRCEQRHI
jgi:hypothetical protein